MDGFAFNCGSIEPLSDIFAIPLSLPISCDMLDMDLQLVPEQAGLSQVLPSQAVLPQVSGLHVIEAIDILPSDIDILASLIDISDVITISDVIECDVLPDDIESCLPVNFPNAATEAPRTKTLATPSQTFCVFIFILPYLRIEFLPIFASLFEVRKLLNLSHTSRTLRLDVPLRKFARFSQVFSQKGRIICEVHIRYDHDFAQRRNEATHSFRYEG